jgi:hypothetical protein
MRAYLRTQISKCMFWVVFVVKRRAFFTVLALLANLVGAAPANAIAFGSVAQNKGGQLNGWALDSSAIQAPITVSVYRDGPKGVGKFETMSPTTILRPDVNVAYNTEGYHGFSWAPPVSEVRGSHIWFVYGIGTDGTSILLTNAPMAYPPISAAAVGPPQPVVIFKTDGCDASDLPDHPARAYRTADGNVNLIASSINARRAVGSDLSTVKHNCAIIHKSNSDPTFNNFNYYQWLQAPYTLDGKTVYNLMHNEWYGSLTDYYCHGDLIDSWVSAMTFAISKDGGAHFNEPLDYIVRKPSTPWNNSFPCSSASPTRYGDLGGSNIIHKGNYYYKFFLYETEPNVVPARSWQCVMRTSNFSGASSWKIWDGVSWTASKSAPCASIPVLQNARSITYNNFLKMYVAIQWFGEGGFVFNVSWDLLNWSAPTSISIPNMDTSTTPYPSLLDPKDKSFNFEETTQAPYLYYTQLHNGTNGDLMRIPLHFVLTGGG